MAASPLSTVRRVLVVKLSSLGDVVHAMPAVQDIVRQCPDAHVDWVVERPFAPLVARCRGVRRVIASDLRGWRHAVLARSTRDAWRSFLAELQRETYDCIIDLQGLTKSGLVARLARRTARGERVAMAHATDGSSWEAPTRWLADRAVALPRHVHAVTRSRLLCAAALGYPVPASLEFGLQAQVHSAQGASKFIADGARGAVLLVHASSRPDKGVPLQHWRTLAERLVAQGWGVLLPQASAAEQGQAVAIAEGLPPVRVLPAMDLAAMVDLMATGVGVIGVDSGLSHIAVALNLPHVQLYNHDTAWRTGPLPEAASRQRSVVGQPHPDLEAVWQHWLAVAPSSP